MPKSAITRATRRKKELLADGLRLLAFLLLVGNIHVELGQLQRSLLTLLGTVENSTETTATPKGASNSTEQAAAASDNNLNEPVISVVSVSCAERYAEVFDLIGSIASRIGKSSIHHYVFTEAASVKKLTEELWGKEFMMKKNVADDSSKLRVEILPLPDKPPIGAASYHMFRKCASARLFLPEAFQHNNKTLPDQLIYIDADAFVTTSLDKLWNLSSTAFEAHPGLTFIMAEESLDKGGLRDKYRSPQMYQINGVETEIHTIPKQNRGYNSGVAAFNMTAWQENNMLDRIRETLAFTKQNRIELKFGDQGVLNYIAAQDESLAMLLPCEWNLRSITYHTCASKFAQVGGGILHGNSHQFLKKDAWLPEEVLAHILRGA